MRFDAGGARVERLGEAVAIVKGLLRGEQVTFAGRHYRVTDHKIHPLPIQRPHPPILIGGNGPRLLTLAAKEADIVGLSDITFRRGGADPDLSGWRVAGVDERLRLVREAAGDRYDRLELNALVQRVVVTDDRRQGAEESTRHAGSVGASRAMSSSSHTWTPSPPPSPALPAGGNPSAGDLEGAAATPACRCRCCGCAALGLGRPYGPRLPALYAVPAVMWHPFCEPSIFVRGITLSGFGG